MITKQGKREILNKAKDFMRICQRYTLAQGIIDQVVCGFDQDGNLTVEILTEALEGITLEEEENYAEF